MTIKPHVKGETTKQGDIVALAHQAVAHPDTVKGEDIDVSRIDAATIICYHAPVEAVANTNPGSFLIQVSPSVSDSSNWATVASHTAAVVTADTEALTAAEPSGDKALTVLATTGFAAADNLYIQDVSEVTTSEWGMCQEIETNNITAVDTVLEKFTIAGDRTEQFAIGNVFTVTGSTGNDGNWTVSTSEFTGGNTEIVVTGDITDATVDGTISFITALDGLRDAKIIGDVIWNDAETFISQLDLTSVVKVRVVFQHEGAAGADVHVKALMIVADID